MTDEAAFLRTICAHPVDDGPRLVYADWLEEQGRCKESEHIRNVLADKFKPENKWRDSTKFSDLLGKTIAGIEGKVGDDSLKFILSTGERYSMHYEPD